MPEEQTMRKRPIAASLKTDLPKREEEPKGKIQSAVESRGSRIAYEVLRDAAGKNKLTADDVADGAFRYLSGSKDLQKAMLARTQKFMFAHFSTIAVPIQGAIDMGEDASKIAAKTAEPLIDAITPPGFVRESFNFDLRDPLKKSFRISASFRSVEDKDQRFVLSYDTKNGMDATYQIRFGGPKTKKG
ncbi:Uncharacterised protein [uncultured archaeon]|nr:Uncharacterised protein [uncultured archaeon]